MTEASLFINDVHLGAPHSLFKDKDPEKELAKFHAEIERLRVLHGISYDGIFSNGDVFDMNHCLRKHADFWRKAGLAWKEKLGPAQFIDGNHEIGVFDRGVPEYLVIKIGGKKYILTHGDYTFWGFSKSYKYRNTNEVGAGFLKRAIAGSFDSFRHLIEIEMDDKGYLERAEYWMKKEGAVGIVQGHKHPTENIDVMIGNYHHLVFKRGINPYTVTI